MGKGKENGKPKGGRCGKDEKGRKSGRGVTPEKCEEGGENTEAGEKADTGEAAEQDTKEDEEVETEKEDESGELKEWKSVKKERWAEGPMIKGRNEPCMVGHVAWAIAGIKGVSVKEVAEAAWANSVRMFGLGERSEEGL